jgi:drug/metabolite transporter (DMT)-like permease
MNTAPPARLNTFLSTTLALTAFAMNSILCRLALREGLIDAASFSTVRLISGALALLVISSLAEKSQSRGLQPNLVSALFLALYVFAFSFAYISLEAGTGTLILFGSVQATMIMFAFFSGEPPTFIECSGLILAIFGLIYLVSPGLQAPPLFSSFLMTISGISWGLYSLRGCNSSHPLQTTTRNFMLAIPFALVITLATIKSSHLEIRGVVIASISGSITSGIGYVIWYNALRGLTATRSAIVQLSVPIIAAACGVALLGERISFRLLVSSVLILGGVSIALVCHKDS